MQYNERVFHSSVKSSTHHTRVVYYICKFTLEMESLPLKRLSVGSWSQHAVHKQDLGRLTVKKIKWKYAEITERERDQGTDRVKRSQLTVTFCVPLTSFWDVSQHPSLAPLSTVNLCQLQQEACLEGFDWKAVREIWQGFRCRPCSRASVYWLPLIQQSGKAGLFVQHTVYSLTGDLTSIFQDNMWNLEAL